MSMDVEDFLEHYGKKGMKWGQRSAPIDRQRNKELNKKSRAKDAKTIEAARARVKSGQTKADFLNAKAAHAENKRKLGTREARRILYEARDKRYEEVAISRTAKNGKEVAISVATGVGALVAYVAISSALNR